MDNKTVYYKPLPPKPATLLILEEGKEARLVMLSGSMRVGRQTPDSVCDITLGSCIASRNHGDFIFEDSEGVYYYRDNNSLNGTFINGVKLEKLNDRGTKAVKLSDGDVLRIDRENLNKPHPDAAIMIFSTVFSKDDKWVRFPLTGKSNVLIGRGISEGLSLNDFMVSKCHALLTLNGDTWSIVDQGSTNGFAVNRQLVIGSSVLKPFDVIRIANTTLIFTGDELVYNEPQPGSMRFDNTHRNVIMNVNIDEVRVRKYASLARKTLLKDINLDIESGDFILILGGAGAGKSTFIKSIMGKVRANGHILFENMDLYKNFKMLKHKIGIVEQFSTTRDNDTVYNTIMDAANIKLAGAYSNEEIVRRVDTIIERMMLTSLTDSLIKNISGGQKKRVEVAIQAIGDQEVFILDEPDSGMDCATRIDLMKNLKPCTETGGVVMVISHSPDDAAHIYNKVIVLAKSQKDEVGHLAYYGDIENAYSFFGVQKLSDIVMEINYEGGKGRGDEFIEKFEKTRRG